MYIGEDVEFDEELNTIQIDSVNKTELIKSLQYNVDKPTVKFLLNEVFHKKEEKEFSLYFLREIIKTYSLNVLKSYTFESYMYDKDPINFNIQKEVIKLYRFLKLTLPTYLDKYKEFYDYDIETFYNELTTKINIPYLFTYFLTFTDAESFNNFKKFMSTYLDKEYLD